MATKSASKKTTKNSQKNEALTLNHATGERRKLRRVSIIILLLVLLGVLLYRNKQLFIVAMVNGQPITKWELNSELNKRYGTRTLDNMISERLVNDEVKKQQVTIRDEELKKKMDELSASLPKGVSFADALKSQGVSEEQFRQQLKLQMSVDALVGRDVSVSAKEVEEYIKDNKQSLTASNPADLTKQAETMLRSQKVQDLFQGWFAALKERASIQRFL